MAFMKGHQVVIGGFLLRGFGWQARWCWKESSWKCRKEHYCMGSKRHMVSIESGVKTEFNARRDGLKSSQELGAVWHMHLKARIDAQ